MEKCPVANGSCDRLPWNRYKCKSCRKFESRTAIIEREASDSGRVIFANDGGYRVEYLTRGTTKTIDPNGNAEWKTRSSIHGHSKKGVMRRW